MATPDKKVKPDKQVTTYPLLRAFIRYTQSTAEDQFEKDVVELATLMKAPEDTVCWVEDDSQEKGLRWVDRDEVNRDTPVFLSVLEDRIK